MKESQVVILGDGDRIRSRVESLLLRGALEELKAFSRALTAAIVACSEYAARTLSAEVIVAGGDDLLLISTSYDRKVLCELCSRFEESTGCTLSFGVGRSLEKAFIELRRAKAEGGGVIFEALE